MISGDDRKESKKKTRRRREHVQAEVGLISIQKGIIFRGIRVGEMSRTIN